MDWGSISFAPLGTADTQADTPAYTPADTPATAITGVFQVPNGPDGTVGLYYIGLPALSCATREPGLFPLGAVVAIIQLPGGGTKACNLKVRVKESTPGSLIFSVNTHTVSLDNWVLYRTREPGEPKWVDKEVTIDQFLADMGFAKCTTVPAPSFEPLLSAPADLLARIKEGGRILGKEPRELITLLQSHDCYYAYDGKSIIVDINGQQFWLQRRQ